jgi:hypothetical protein
VVRLGRAVTAEQKRLVGHSWLFRNASPCRVREARRRPRPLYDQRYLHQEGRQVTFLEVIRDWTKREGRAARQQGLRAQRPRGCRTGTARLTATPTAALSRRRSERPASRG